MKKVSGAKAVILSLLEEKVDTIFGYPGGANMPIYDVLYDYEEEIDHVLVRHEQAATHAAQAYSQVTEKVGVCLATSGPGATNLITGITNANIDSVPMVIITAQVVSNLIGSDAFQETDVVGVSMPVTKWNYQVTKATEIPEAIAKAFYIAVSGRPGVVVIDITKDALIEEIEYEYKQAPKIRSYTPYPEIKGDSLNAAVELINNAKKPILLLGHGVLIAKAEKEIREFVEKADIPFACTLLGLSAISSRHRLFTGMLGMHGNFAPNKLTNEADVIIAAGMRFDDRVTGRLSGYAKQAKIIHIEVDKAEINKNVEVDVAIHADVKAVLTAMNPLLNKNEHTDWLNRFNELYKEEFDAVIDKDIHPKGKEIRMSEVVHLVSELSKGEAIVTTDVGQNQMTTARYFKFENPNSLITSGGLGTMGFGLPSALGCSKAHPDKQVICFTGDGGFQMNIQELATIMQEDLPLKVVVLNNSFLGMVRQWQDMFMEKRYSGTIMKNPDFITIAKGFGIKGQTVKSRENLADAIQEMLDSKKAYVLEVIVEQESNVFPMIPPGAAVDEVLLKLES